MPVTTFVTIVVWGLNIFSLRTASLFNERKGKKTQIQEHTHTHLSFCTAQLQKTNIQLQ